MAGLFNVVGFVLSALLAWVFGGVLRGGYMGGYELAVFLSLSILSAFSTLLFGSLLLTQAAQWWKDHQRLAPVLNATFSSPLPIAPIAPQSDARPVPRSRLPQSEFARRWGQRHAFTYEQILQDSLTCGEQRPHRLKCSEWNRLMLRLAGPYPRPALSRSRRRRQSPAPYLRYKPPVH